LGAVVTIVVFGAVVVLAAVVVREGVVVEVGRVHGGVGALH
jgi:hypothetical protein